MERREIGPYVLLHKLAEDSLSKTYRAGLKAGDDVERVVLLCLFQAGSDDVEWIAETAAIGRRALEGLASPHLADLVDSGEIDGVAFLAYDYVPGTTLSGLMRESRRHQMHVPLGLALMIANRSAEGLVAAWQHESRMLHGFLVPALVLVSNEGEVKVLGFEVASRLRRLLKFDGVRQELGVYLAPEVVPEGQPATTDDVFSLGAMLFELVTGSIPPASQAELDAAVASATAADGTELAEEIRDLLSTSLAGPPRRATLKDWSETLREIILSGRYEASSFDLAFFLNRLLGHDFDQEVDDTGPSPAATDVANALATVQMRLEDTDMGRHLEARAAEDTVEDVDDSPTAGTDDVVAGGWAPAELSDDAAQPSIAAEFAEANQDSGSQKRLLLIAASVVVVLLASLGVSYYFNSDSKPSVSATMGRNAATLDGSLTQPAVQPPGGLAALGVESTGASGAQSSEAAPATPAGAMTAAGRPVQSQPSTNIDRQVQKLVAKQSATIEASLRDEYTQQIAALQSELEAQRLAAPTDPAAPTGPAADTPVDSTLMAAQPAQPLDASTSEPDQTLAQTTAADTAPLPAAVLQPSATIVDITAQDYSTPTQQTAVEQRSGANESFPTAVTSGDQDEDATTTEPVAGAGAEPTSTKVGDLVTPGQGVEPPTLEQSVQPHYPLMAKRLNRQAVVTVRVLVDETGHVIEVEQLGEKAGYGFDEEAVKTAQEMIWKPATKDGVKVKMWSTLRLAFKP